MPCGVTSQMGPTFSVTSMRPSGRKAMRQGRLKVATDVMLNGTLASGFWSPAFTWAATGAYAPPDNNATSRAVFAILVMIFFLRRLWAGKITDGAGAVHRTRCPRITL